MASVTSPFKGALLLPSSSSKKKRGSYNCGRCGLPKKGHVCALAPPSSTAAAEPSPLPPPRSGNRLRRALSFDDDDDGAYDPLCLSHQEVQRFDEAQEEEEEEEEELVGVGTAGLVPLTSLVEVFRRVPVKGLLAAGAVCRSWRHCVKRMWRSAEELRISVSPCSQNQIGFLESVLEKCMGLVRLTLRMQRLQLCLFVSLPSLHGSSVRSDIYVQICDNLFQKYQ